MSVFKNIENDDLGETYTPYASKSSEGWRAGSIHIDYLNKHYGHLKTAEEMKNATESEGLQLYFTWLRDEGILD